MKDQLINKGWVCYYECGSPCNKQYFSHADKPGYEIRVRKKSSTFSILLKNLIISGPHWSHDLDKKLNEFEI